VEEFKYKARRRDGSMVSGIVTAPNEAAVAAYIQRQNMYVAGISKSTVWTKQFSALFEKGINTYDIALFCRQFATLLSAGVPLLNGIEILSQQMEKNSFKLVLMDLAAKIKAGRSLSSVMEEYPKVFPELLTNMVAAGETGGILEVVMERMATQLEKDYRMNQKFKSAMVYPAIVLSVAAIVVAIIMTFVMPVFVGLFESLKIPLPIVTQIIIGLSNFVRNFWYLIVAVIIGGVFAYRQALKSENFRLWQDGVFLKVPIFGALYNKIIITRFSRTFASLSRSGVPILQGLAIVSRATGSLQAAKVLNEARISLTEGNSLSEPMEKSGLFPPMVISLTKIGEDTGSLDAMLDKVAEFYGAEVDDMVARMQTILDPILIVILGIVIGTLAVGLLLPMFEIVTKVGNL
jgi:type IV pilus assembly protein PilC